MAITEREDMKTAWELKKEGWVHILLEDKSLTEVKEMALWCHTTFGMMHTIMDPKTFSNEGKWFGAELPFQTGGVGVNKQFVLLFRDEKIRSMFNMMFGV